MSRFGVFWENLLFPPRCIGCGELMQRDVLDPCQNPLCYKCYSGWIQEKTQLCPDCGLTMSHCPCCPSGTRKAGIEKTLKLVNYPTDRMTAGRRSILNMKKRLDHRAFRFFAEQLSVPLKAYMAEQRLTREEVAVCHIPRGKKNKNRYGFDQAEELCRRLSALLEVRHLDILYRVSGGREQKKLNASQRAQNAACGLGVDRARWKAYGKEVTCLVLVDDIATTGNSLMSGAKAIRPYFDGRIIALVLAKTPKG